jgi:hypothetical protein
MDVQLPREHTRRTVLLSRMTKSTRMDGMQDVRTVTRLRQNEVNPKYDFDLYYGEIDKKKEG